MDPSLLPTGAQEGMSQDVLCQALLPSSQGTPSIPPLTTRSPGPLLSSLRTP
jgi:hypothetical protein